MDMGLTSRFLIGLTLSLFLALDARADNILPQIALLRVPNNAALGLLTLTSFPVSRAGFAAAGDGGDAVYTHSSGACAHPDNGLQVAAADGGCWTAAVPPTGVDLRVWGADASGNNDSAAALTKALTAGVPLRIGNGFYSLNSLVSVTTNAAINISGNGPGASYFQCKATAGCLDLTENNVLQPVKIEGVSFVATLAGAKGTALALNYAPSPSNEFAGAILKDLNFIGGNFAANTFVQMIALTNAWGADLDTITVTGATGNPSLATAALNVGCGSKGVVATHLHFFSVGYGIYINDAASGCMAAGAVEGLDVGDFEFVGVNWGFFINHLVNTGGTTIHDGHIEGNAGAISMTNQDQMSVHDILVLNASGATNNAWAGISATTSNLLDVHDVQFALAYPIGTGSATGIVINNSKWARVADVTCLYWTAAGSCLELEGSSDYAHYHDISFDTMSTSGAGQAALDRSTGLNNKAGDGNAPLANGGTQTLSVNAASPSVGHQQWPLWLASNTSATSIGTFTGAFQGQVIEVRATNGNTTLVSSGGLVLKGFSNVNLVNGNIITLMFTGSIWLEIARNF
jgi:hypothetical protein